MAIVTSGAGGKVQLSKDFAFRQFFNSSAVGPATQFTDLFNDWDDKVKDVAPDIAPGALSNAHGDWYEWLLAIASWNAFQRNRSNHIAVLLPNVSRLNIAKLYTDELAKFIHDLRAKVLASSTVEFISSNPDFVIIDTQLANPLITSREPISQIGPDTLNMLGTAYRVFESKCSFESIVGYLSVKNSLRPDRRLQMAHEGSLMKALYVHLQTRQWITDPKGIKYYAMSTRVGAPDIAALNTVATHSITTVQSRPQPAVDKAFEVNSLEQAELAFDEILSAV